MLFDEAGDGLMKSIEAAVYAAPDLTFGEQCEEALDLVYPRGAGRCEVDMPAWPLDQPAANDLGFVGGVIVHDKVDIEVRGDVRFDFVEKLAELARPMTRIAFSDHMAGRDVERCK